MKVPVQTSHRAWAAKLNTLRLEVYRLVQYETYAYEWIRKRCEALTGDDVIGAISPEHLPPQTPERKREYDTLREVVAGERQMMQSLRDYKRLLHAYRNNDQKVVAELIPGVFYNQDKSLIHGGLLFHGIDFDPYKTPVDAYIDLAMKIQDEGLKPSPSDRFHWCMDEHIRALFCVTVEYWTHGLLFFGFEPSKGGYAVFSGGYIDQERMVYAPLIDLPLKLYLKTPSHWLGQSDDKQTWDVGDRCNTTYGELHHYRDQLEERLQERDIPFELHEELRPLSERRG